MQIPHISLIKRIGADIFLEAYDENECIVHSSAKEKEDVLFVVAKYFSGKKLTIQESEESSDFRSWKLKIN